MHWTSIPIISKPNRTTHCICSNWKLLRDEYWIVHSSSDSFTCSTKIFLLQYQQLTLIISKSHNLFRPPHAQRQFKCREHYIWSTLEYTWSLQQMEYNFPDSSMTVMGTRFSDTLAGQTGVLYREIGSKILKMHFNRCSKMQINILHN